MVSRFRFSAYSSVLYLSHSGQRHEVRTSKLPLRLSGFHPFIHFDLMLLIQEGDHLSVGVICSYRMEMFRLHTAKERCFAQHDRDGGVESGGLKVSRQNDIQARPPMIKK